MTDADAIAAIRPSLRATLADLYDELAQGSAMLGQTDLAARCRENAEALRYGGVLRLEEEPTCTT